MEDKKMVIPVYLDATELPDHLEQLGYEETCVYFYPDEPEESMGEIIAYMSQRCEIVSTRCINYRKSQIFV